MLFDKPDKSVASRQRILSLAARCVCSRVAEYMVLPSTIEPIVSSMKRFAKALYLKGTEASNPPSTGPFRAISHRSGGLSEVGLLLRRRSLANFDEP
jgi:hypothetical protein